VYSFDTTLKILSELSKNKLINLYKLKNDYTNEKDSTKLNIILEKKSNIEIKKIKKIYPSFNNVEYSNSFNNELIDIEIDK